MDLTSPYFPVRVKQEPLDDTYDGPHYHSPFFPVGGYVKPEPPSHPYTHTIAEADSAGPPLETLTAPKKKGKKKKIKQEAVNGSEPKIGEVLKERKKVDRFNGMPEEEVVKRTLPDHLVPNLDIIVIGINPGLFAAYKGHHYAGPGNHFWKCLYLSGLIPEPMTSDDDFRLIDYGVGFTNMVERTTRGSADLSRKEIKDGAKILLQKLQKFQPKIAVFNGKGIYEVFSGKKNFDFGKQPDLIEGTGTVIFVMPSSSARCAQLPRAIDKVPFYEALKKLRDHLSGKLAILNESEVTFPDVKLKIDPDDGLKTEPLDIKDEPDDRGLVLHDMDSMAGTQMAAASSVSDSDRPKAKKKKKYTPKKKQQQQQQQQQQQREEEENSVQQQQPQQMGQVGYGNQYSPGDNPGYLGIRVKQEKPDDVMYHGYPQQGAPGCPYGGGYVPPPAHSGGYYGNPPNAGAYGPYPPPSSAHQPQFVSSGSLNQLESFVDQIPNIGMTSALPPPPPAHVGGNYQPQYGNQMTSYPHPPPAHDHQANGGNAANGGMASSFSSPPPSAFAPTPYNPPADPTPPPFGAPQSQSPFCPDSYQQPRSSSPVYTDLDSVQVKQERIDPCYGAY